jgi:DNA polymerase-3 subunit alpha
MKEGEEVVIGCMLAGVKSRVAKSGRSAGQKWAILELEDLDGKIEGMCFAETYAGVMQKYPGVLAADKIVFVKGKVDRKRETPSLMVNDVIPIEESATRLSTAVKVKLDPAVHNEKTISDLLGLVMKNPGNMDLHVEISLPDKRVLLKTGREPRLCLTKEFIAGAESLLGKGSVDLAGAGNKRIQRLKQQKIFQDAEVAAGPAEASTPMQASRLSMEDPGDEPDMTE